MSNPPSSRSRRTFAASLAALAGSAAFAQPQLVPPGGPPQGMRERPGSDMKGMMRQMNEDMMSMRMSGDIDMDFAMMMKRHHEGALDMAREEVRRGNHPRMRAMAQKMIRDQRREIEELDQFIRRRGERPALRR